MRTGLLACPYAMETGSRFTVFTCTAVVLLHLHATTMMQRAPQLHFHVPRFCASTWLCFCNAMHHKSTAQAPQAVCNQFFPMQ
jgi:hypothetical protein